MCRRLPGLAPPVLWGDEATVRARLGENFEEIRTELIPVDFDMPVNRGGGGGVLPQVFWADADGVCAAG